MLAHKKRLQNDVLGIKLVRADACPLPLLWELAVQRTTLADPCKKRLTDKNETRPLLHKQRRVSLPSQAQPCVRCWVRR